MVISEFTGFPGCMMDCRVIGCIQAEQSEGKKMIRNDRFLAVPEQSAVFENVISIEDIPPTLVMEIEEFFNTYMHKEGKEFRLIGNLNAAQAVEALKKTKVEA